MGGREATTATARTQSPHHEPPLHLSSHVRAMKVLRKPVDLTPFASQTPCRGAWRTCGAAARTPGPAVGQARGRGSRGGSTMSTTKRRMRSTTADRQVGLGSRRAVRAVNAGVRLSPTETFLPF